MIFGDLLSMNYYKNKLRLWKILSLSYFHKKNDSYCSSIKFTSNSNWEWNIVNSANKQYIWFFYRFIFQFCHCLVSIGENNSMVKYWMENLFTVFCSPLHTSLHAAAAEQRTTPWVNLWNFINSRGTIKVKTNI